MYRMQNIKVSTPLTVTDSERTFIIERRGGPGSRGAWTGGRGSRRSAYFADSDTSEASGVGEASRKVLVTRENAVNASIAAWRTGGRRVLEGIRDSHGQIVCSNQQQQQQHQLLQQRQGRGNHGEDPRRREEHMTSARESLKQDRQAPVFYGNVRFPASRVALWDRRATGSPFTLTPESAAPMLVLRQQVVDVIASTLCRCQEEAPGQGQLQWRGMLGTAAAILQGHAATDPRVRSATSGVALEILGVGNQPTPVISGAAGVPRHARGEPNGSKKGCGLPLNGALTVAGEDGDCRHSGGSSTPGPDEKLYRSLMLDRTAAIKGAKSADPAAFTPLRLHCSLKRRGSGAGRLWSHESSPGRRLGSHGQAPAREAVSVTLSLRGEMIVPAVGVRLIPIPPLALLHTALYQSLLTREAEDKPQSGLLTLNEGRRAVLLSDTDPLSFRAPVVGVWVSGRIGDLNTAGGSPSSPRSHPLTFPACLRFLLGVHAGAGGGGRSKAAVGTDAFLVLQLHGGGNGTPPTFYEARATHSDDRSSIALAGAPGWDASSSGFEQLDFSADVDVDVEPWGESRRGVGVGGNGRIRSRRKGNADRVVVIGRLRSVSNPLFAEPFSRALEDVQGSDYFAVMDAETSASSPIRVGHAAAVLVLFLLKEESRLVLEPRWRRAAAQPPSPGPLPPAREQPPPRTPSSSRPVATAGVRGARWHVRHHATSDGDESAENIDPKTEFQPLRTPATASPSPEALVAVDVGSTPPPRRHARPFGDDHSTSRNRESIVTAPESESHAPDRTPTPRRLNRVTAEDGRSVTPTTGSSGNAMGNRVEGEESRGAVLAASSLATATGSTEVAAVGPSESRNEEELTNLSHASEGDTLNSGSAEPPASTPSPPRDGKQTIRQQRLLAGEQEAMPDERGDAPSAKIAQDDCATCAHVGANKDRRGVTDVLPTRSTTTFSTVQASAAQHRCFDLEKLDPAARDFFLAQQRQLLALEEQLRLLQAAMQDRGSQWQHPLIQQQQQQQPVRRPVEQSLFSVSSGGPVLLVRAATELTSPRWGGGVERTTDRTAAAEHRIVEDTRSPVAEARVTLAEASTNTSFVWGAKPQGKVNQNRGVSAAAEDVPASPCAAGKVASEAGDSGDGASRGRRASVGEPSEAECQASAHSPPAKRPTVELCTPDLIDAPSHCRTAQTRVGTVDESQRWSHFSDVRSVSSMSEVAEDELEAPSLGRQLPGIDAGSPRTLSVREARLSKVAREAVVIELDSPSQDGDKTPRKANKEENNGRGGGGKRDKSGDAAKHAAPPLPAGTRGSDEADGDRESAAGNGIGGGGDLRRQWPQLRPDVPGRWKNDSVGPVPIADLVVVPRIEFGQLTDDELGSDLDEGETIWRIESKYLKGGGVTRVSRRSPFPPTRGSLGSWR